MSQLTKILSEIGKGKVLSEADERLGQLIGSIREHGGAGSLQVTLKIRSISGATVQVEGASAIKLPPIVQPVSIFFTTEENTLSRDNPEQRELNFRAIPGGMEEKKEPEQIIQ